MSTTDSNNFAWLAAWYGAQCNGDWEHSYGVSIDSLDNPGWIVKVDLKDTLLANVPFEPVRHNPDAADSDPTVRWRHCKVTDQRFEGAGGVHDLDAIIGVFRHWAEANGNR